MKKLSILSILSILLPLLCFSWGEKGSKWHYSAQNEARKKAGLTAVWESVADTMYQGKNCHLFVKYYVDSNDKRKTINLDTLYQYTNINVDTFYRWLKRTKSWEIHYHIPFYDGKSSKQVKLQLEGKSDNSFFDSITAYLPGGKMKTFFSGDSIIYRSIILAFGTEDDGDHQWLKINSAFGNISCFRIEEGIAKYAKDSIYEDSYPLLCYYDATTKNTYINDANKVKSCFKYISRININELSKENSTLSLFPNPSNGIFTIKNNGKKVEGVVLFNSLGQTIISDIKLNEQSENQLDISKYPSGLYFLKGLGVEIKVIKE